MTIWCYRWRWFGLSQLCFEKNCFKVKIWSNKVLTFLIFHKIFRRFSIYYLDNKKFFFGFRCFQCCFEKNAWGIHKWRQSLRKGGQWICEEISLCTSLNDNGKRLRDLIMHDPRVCCEKTFLLICNIDSSRAMRHDDLLFLMLFWKKDEKIQNYEKIRIPNVLSMLHQ